MSYTPKHSRREVLAEYAHEAWSGWMRYFFEKCRDPHEDDTIVVPGGYVRALNELMDTPYAELSEEQKESDRAEADKILSLLRAGDHNV